MPLSDSERLAVLKEERDTLEAQLSSGVYRYKIGNREVERSDVIARLKYLNEQIAVLAPLVSSSSSPTRNLIKLTRRA